MRSALTAPVVLAVALAATEADAQPRTEPGRAPLPRLYVRRSPEANDCPDAPELAEAVAKQMGRPALDTSPDPSLATIYDIEVFRGIDGYTAVIRASGRGAAGAREIVDPGDTCAGLAAALPVTLSILLDAEAPERPKPLPPPPRPAPAPPPARPPSRVGLSIGAIATAGLGPAPTSGLAGAIDGRIVPRLGLRAGAMWVPPTSSDVPGIEGARVDVGLVLGKAGACAWLTNPASEGPSLSACIDLLAGAVHGATTGLAEHPGGSDASTTEAWVGASAGLAARIPLSSAVALVLDAGVVAPLSRTSFRVGHVDELVFEASPIAGVGVLGLRLSIW